MKTCKIEWYDDVNTASWKLAAPEYGVELEQTKVLNEDEVELAVRGPRENVKAFVEDVDSGDVRPMCDKRSLDEDGYAEWLETELNKVA